MTTTRRGRTRVRHPRGRRRPSPASRPPPAPSPRPPSSRPPASPARRASSARSRPSASRSSSASRAARSCPPTTRCSTRRSATSWSATSRAPGTPPPGTPRPPARSASAWRPPGPGATNLVTPLADAHMDSVPIVAITGQVPSHAIGTDAFQEADIRGITMPVTKHNFLVTDAAEIPQRIAEAFHLASTGRPGPVLVDIPKDVLQATHRLRLAAADGPARLQADHPPARQAGPRGRGADRRRAAARCSTSAAACSRPAPPRSWPSWPS